MMKSHKKRIWREKLWKIRDHKCMWCGLDLDIDVNPNSKNFPTIEHIVPASHGGSSHIDNLGLACPACNNARQIPGVPSESCLKKIVRGRLKCYVDTLGPITLETVDRAADLVMAGLKSILQSDIPPEPKAKPLRHEIVSMAEAFEKFGPKHQLPPPTQPGSQRGYEQENNT